MLGDGRTPTKKHTHTRACTHTRLIYNTYVQFTKYRYIITISTSHAHICKKFSYRIKCLRVSFI